MSGTERVENRMSLDRNARSACAHAILVTGGARNGTTIVGKLIHSMRNVEYTFEPSPLFGLFALMEDLPQDQWTLLYEAYLYEGFLVETMSGRSLNCNVRDDSSIFKVKDATEIKTRLSRSLTKTEAAQLAASSSLAYKIPDVVPMLPRLLEYYPETKVVLMVRNPVETIHSLLERGWFSNASLSQENRIWPFRALTGIRTPFWVNATDIDLWQSMSEVGRCAYYWLRMCPTPSILSSVVVMKYSDLVADPSGQIRQLADSLNLEYGPKTEELLATVALRSRPRPESILDSIAPDLKDRILGLYKSQS